MANTIDINCVNGQRQDRKKGAAPGFLSIAVIVHIAAECKTQEMSPRGTDFEVVTLMDKWGSGQCGAVGEYLGGGVRVVQKRAVVS